MSPPPVDAGLPDVLGTKFSENEIYDFLGLHVAFSAERRGEEHVFRATVQNNWNAARHVKMDTATITARLPLGYIVWNVAGAAPVYVEEVAYRSATTSTSWT